VREKTLQLQVLRPCSRWLCLVVCGRSADYLRTRTRAAEVIQTGLMTPYLTTDEVAAIIRETPENVRRRCANGQLAAKRLGGRWLVSELDLAAFMEAPRTGSPRRRLTKRQRDQLLK
jgi:excisionase family DNA binding protein